jgi:hypothetical protein
MDKFFAMADNQAMKADAATRVLVYDNAIKNGLSEVEADMAVMESMNFHKRGLAPTVQYASRMIPFFNSQIQGLNVLFKAATGNMPFNEQLRIKQKFQNNAMMLMGMGLVYAMMMEDDEYFKNAKPKDKYSCSVIGGISDKQGLLHYQILTTYNDKVSFSTFIS